MSILERAVLTACVCLQTVVLPLDAQSTARTPLPPKGCWTKKLIWTLARQELPVPDPTRWNVIAQSPWTRWKSGIPLETRRGDQLLLTVTTLDNWQMLLASGPADEPVVLTRLDVLCTFVHEQPDLRIVFSTRTFW